MPKKSKAIITIEPEGKNGNNQDKPYKWKIADIYAFWCAIPLALKWDDDKKFNKFRAKIIEFCWDELGVEVEALLDIKNDRQFVSHFNISKNQPWLWKQTKYHKDKVAEFNSWYNVEQFEKDIDFKFTMDTLKDPDVSRVKLWKELYKGQKVNDDTQHAPVVAKIIIENPNAKSTPSGDPVEANA